MLKRFWYPVISVVRSGPIARGHHGNNRSDILPEREQRFGPWQVSGPTTAETASIWYFTGRATVRTPTGQSTDRITALSQTGRGWTTVPHEDIEAGSDKAACRRGWSCYQAACNWRCGVMTTRSNTPLHSLVELSSAFLAKYVHRPLGQFFSWLSHGDHSPTCTSALCKNKSRKRDGCVRVGDGHREPAAVNNSSSK